MAAASTLIGEYPTLQRSKVFGSGLGFVCGNLGVLVSAAARVQGSDTSLQGAGGTNLPVWPGLG